MNSLQTFIADTEATAKECATRVMKSQARETHRLFETLVKRAGDRIGPPEHWRLASPWAVTLEVEIEGYSEGAEKPGHWFDFLLIFRRRGVPKPDVPLVYVGAPPPETLPRREIVRHSIRVRAVAGCDTPEGEITSYASVLIDGTDYLLGPAKADIRTPLPD